MKDVTDVMGMGSLSIIEDPTGAALGLWQPKSKWTRRNSLLPQRFDRLYVGGSQGREQCRGDAAASRRTAAIPKLRQSRAPTPNSIADRKG
jgi:hypothetical protein